MKNNDFDILDLFYIIKKYKKQIIIVTFISSFVAIIYSLFATKYWISRASILGTNTEGSPLSIGNTSLMGLGSTLLGNSLQSEAIDLVTIMNSRTFSEAVIEKFKLIDYLQIDEPDSLIALEIALEKLKEDIVNIHLNEENGVISISTETKNKFLSEDIANFYHQNLETYNQQNRLTKSRQKRKFIEKRLVEVKSEIDRLSNELLDYNKLNNTIEINSQIQSSINIYTDLVSQKYLLDLERDFALKYAYSSESEIEKIQLKSQLINEKIQNFEKNTNLDNAKYIMPLNTISKKAIELSQIKLKLDIQEKIYHYLYPQYEQARIEEIKDIPTIEILDEAKPAGRRSKPKRAKICIIVFLLSLSVSIFVAILIERFKIYLRSEAALEKIEKMKNMK